MLFTTAANYVYRKVHALITFPAITVVFLVIDYRTLTKEGSLQIISVHHLHNVYTHRSKPYLYVHVLRCVGASKALPSVYLA